MAGGVLVWYPVFAAPFRPIENNIMLYRIVVDEHRHAFGQDFLHGGQRAVLRGAARAEGDGAEPGLQRIQARACVARSFSAPLGVLGGKNSRLRACFMACCVRRS